MRRLDKMNTKDPTELLFEKMSAEQDKFRDWSKTQPADEILNHSLNPTFLKSMN